MIELPQSKMKLIDGKEYYCTPFSTTKMTIHFIRLTKMIGVPLTMIAGPFVNALSAILGKVINRAMETPPKPETEKTLDDVVKEKTEIEAEKVEAENEDKALFDVLPQALEILLTNVDEKTVNGFILELLEKTQCDTTDLNKPGIYDVHFAGKLDLLMKVLYFVIETNYGGIKKFIL